MQIDDADKIPDEIIINGIRINSAGLMGLFLMIFNPLPDRWMRFEKQGEALLVEVRREEKVGEPPAVTLQ